MSTRESTIKEFNATLDEYMDCVKHQERRFYDPEFNAWVEALKEELFSEKYSTVLLTK